MGLRRWWRDQEFDIWKLVYASNGQGLRDQISPPSGIDATHIRGLILNLFTKSGAVVLAQGMSAKAASAIYELARGVIDKGGIEEKDVRVLPILFDLAEERWRTITEAVPDYDEVDLPIFLFRVLAPYTGMFGLDFVQHHKSWLRKSRVKIRGPFGS